MLCYQRNWPRKGQKRWYEPVNRAKPVLEPRVSYSLACLGICRPHYKPRRLFAHWKEVDLLQIYTTVDYSNSIQFGKMVLEISLWSVWAPEKQVWLTFTFAQHILLSGLLAIRRRRHTFLPMDTNCYWDPSRVYPIYPEFGSSSIIWAEGHMHPHRLSIILQWKEMDCKCAHIIWKE